MRGLPDFEHTLVCSDWQMDKTVAGGKPALYIQYVPC